MRVSTTVYVGNQKEIVFPVNNGFISLMNLFTKSWPTNSGGPQVKLGALKALKGGKHGTVYVVHNGQMKGSPWFSRGLPTGVIPTQLPWYQWKYFSSQRSYSIMNRSPCGCLQERQGTAGPSTTLSFYAPGDCFLCRAAI